MDETSTDWGISASHAAARRDRAGASHDDHFYQGKSDYARGTMRVENVLKNRSHGLQGFWMSFLDRAAVMRDKEVPRNGLRRFVYLVQRSQTFQFIMAVVIVGHLSIGVHETDLRAEGRVAPTWLTTSEVGILSIYFFDLILRLFATRLAFFLDPWHFLDVSLLLCDLILLLPNLFSSSVASQSVFGRFNLLRSVRLLRVFQVLKNFLIFREVYLMIQAVFSALRAILFGGIIAFGFMTSLSLLAVEILNPLVIQLAEQGVFDDCERCHRAFSSVMASNLTFMKTIVAGDSWGQISVPLMENYKEAAVLLTVAIISIQMGLVNIIMAVIVDRVSEARVNDNILRKKMKEEALEKSYRRLWRIFQSMDEDGNGNLSVQEMREAYRDNIEFKFLMNSMDFSSDNISLFFDILDKDCSGEVSYEEFVEQLHMMREFDGHTMLVIIRHLVESLQEHIDEKFDDRMINGWTDCSAVPKDPEHPESFGLAGEVFALAGEGFTLPGNEKDALLPFDAIKETVENTQVQLCTQMLEHIATLEADMNKFAKAMESLIENSYGDPVSANEAIASNSEGFLPLPKTQAVDLTDSLDTKASWRMSQEKLIQKVLQRTHIGLSESSELSQIKNSVQLYLSCLVSWGRLQEYAFHVDSFDDVSRFLSRKVFESVQLDIGPANPPESNARLMWLPNPLVPAHVD